MAQVLTTATAAPPLAALEAGFKGKGPWKKGLPRILETLEALGRVRRMTSESADAGVLWQAGAHAEDLSITSLKAHQHR